MFTSVVCHVCFAILGQFLACLFTTSDCATYDELGKIGAPCIREFDYEISRLSPGDRAKVSELSFLFVQYRHGTRHPGRDINDYFPSADISYRCNEQTVWGSSIDTFDGMDTKPRSFESKFRLKLDHVDNEQNNINNNCQNTQISDSAPREMIETGKIVAERYFNKKGKYRASDRFDAKYRKARFITSKAVQSNRVLSSHLYFMEGFLAPKKSSQPLLTLEHHDFDSDPFRQDRPQGVLCRNDIDGAYSSWRSLYNAAQGNTAVRTAFESSLEAQVLQAQFEFEGGVGFGSGSVADITFSYCAGVDIPLSEQTLTDIMSYYRTLNSLYDESPEQIELNKCFYHQVQRPAYGRIKQAIEEALRGGKDARRIYILSNQGFGIRSFLFGLDLLENREQFDQGEVMTLEVYERKRRRNRKNRKESDFNMDDYYFRVTRNGEFVVYPPCQEIYDLEQTELCSLSVLMNDEYGFADATTVEEWGEVCVNAIDECWCGLCESED